MRSEPILPAPPSRRRLPATLPTSRPADVRALGLRCAAAGTRTLCALSAPGFLRERVGTRSRVAPPDAQPLSRSLGCLRRPRNGRMRLEQSGREVCCIGSGLQWRGAMSARRARRGLPRALHSTPPAGRRLRGLPSRVGPESAQPNLVFAPPCMLARMPLRARLQGGASLCMRLRKRRSRHRRLCEGLFALRASRPPPHCESVPLEGWRVAPRPGGLGFGPPRPRTRCVGTCQSCPAAPPEPANALDGASRTPCDESFGRPRLPLPALCRARVRSRTLFSVCYSARWTTMTMAPFQLASGT